VKRTLSAGVIPVRRVGGGWQFLVLRAFRNWDFPKGVVNPGEEPLAAAKREVTEETGLRDLDFTFGEEYRETVPYATGKVARYYIAETQEEEVNLPISHELGRPEHHEWRWVTCHEAEELLPPRLSIILDWVREVLDE
jgi:8-oxo-dGTP pyrophosphatase MutT (NUDIX family)